MITYCDDKKDLPPEQLYQLFMQAGWVRGETETTPEQLSYFNAPFINSTLVVSAWEDSRLVGAVRVLSDGIIRSVIYDLVVNPGFQGQGIGKELVKRCMAVYPKSEWLVQTTKDVSGYYEKLGFTVNNEVFLTVPSVYQQCD